MSAPHHAAPGASNDWYTPRNIFEALGVRFDLDPASPGAEHWVPADSVYTKQDDGLSQPWRGSVWLNPPFGGRNGVVPWLEKFFHHGDGIVLVNSLTSAGWFHDWAPYADAILFPRGKTRFVRPDGSVGVSPANGIALMSKGRRMTEALLRAAPIGFVVRPVNICETGEQP